MKADDRKKRTLAAYDAIARSGVAGPKIVVREELEHMDSKWNLSLTLFNFSFDNLANPYHLTMQYLLIILFSSPRRASKAQIFVHNLIQWRIFTELGQHEEEEEEEK